MRGVERRGCSAAAAAVVVAFVAFEASVAGASIPLAVVVVARAAVVEGMLVVDANTQPRERY